VRVSTLLIGRISTPDESSVAERVSLDHCPPNLAAQKCASAASSLGASAQAKS